MIRLLQEAPGQRRQRSTQRRIFGFLSVLAFLLLCSRPVRAGESLEDIDSRAQAAAPAQRAQLYLDAARASYWKDLNEGRELASKALAAAQASQQPEALFDAFALSAHLALLASKPDEAAPHLQALDELLKNPQLDGRRAEALWLHGLHGVLERRNDDAERDFNAAIALAQTSGDRAIQAKALHGRAQLLIKTGRQADAERLLEQSLAINQAIGREREADANRHYLGFIARDRGEYDRAMSLHLEVLSHAEARDDVQAVAHSANALGIIEGHKSQGEESRRYFSMARDAYRRLGDRYSESMALINIGDSLAGEKQWNLAMPALNEALAIAREVNSADAEILARSELTAGWLGQGKTVEAEREADAARKLAGSASAIRKQQAAQALANVRSAQGRPAEAATLLREALDQVRETGRQNDVAQTLFDLAAAEAQAHQEHDAYAHEHEGRQLADKLNDETITRRVLDISAHYEAQRREAELAAQQARIAALEQEARQQRDIRISLAAALLSAALMLFALISRARTKQRAERELQAKNELIERANRDLAEAADGDPLTGARNRRFFQTRVLPQLQTAVREKRPFAVVLIDADQFKSINDRHGHDCGDAALVAIVAAWNSVLRDGDHLMRWGGEEFLAVLADRTSEQVRERIAAGLAATRAIRLDTETHSPPISVSAGWVQAPWPGAEIADLLRVADLALLQAKRDGRDRAVGVVPAGRFDAGGALPEMLSGLDGVGIEGVR